MTSEVRSEKDLKDQRTMACYGVDLLVKEAHGAALKAGWWDGVDINARGIVPEKLCLIHSEISEALEGDRKGLMDEHLPEFTSFEVELADAMIRIGDLAGAKKARLSAAIYAKMAFNEQRADHKKENREAPGGKKY